MSELHQGHRERAREKFKKLGAAAFADHELLELVLYYAVPRGDVNPLAHRLLKKFGSLYNLTQATAEAIKTVPGAGESVALYIRLLTQFAQRCKMSYDEIYAEDRILTADEASALLVTQYMGEGEEVVRIMTLKAGGQLIAIHELFKGSIAESKVYTRSLLKYVIDDNAAAVILAHNHPSGVALPSQSDTAVTKLLQDNLKLADVRLVDHIIIAGEDWVSLKNSGLMK